MTPTSVARERERKRENKVMRMRVIKGMKSSIYSFLSFALLVLSAPAPASGRRLLEQKPDTANAAAVARWLVAENSWGVLSTISIDLKGAPFGNVVSFSDGLPGKGLGLPYFYLTELDPTARDALKDKRVSFTLSEVPIGTCGKIDPENPECAKLTLSGKLKQVNMDSKEGEFALSALFAKHPEMEGWPKSHEFEVFKLKIENLFLIAGFGGPKPLNPREYFKHEK